MVKKMMNTNYMEECLFVINIYIYTTRTKTNHDLQIKLLLPLDLNKMSNSFTGLSGLVISLI